MTPDTHYRPDRAGVLLACGALADSFRWDDELGARGVCGEHGDQAARHWWRVVADADGYTHAA